ncbi:hypothetical protein [Winogradskyella jejuensis]|uniref:Erythromycin esterase n=1 Tax=Winogradskyella jejuensis TaxID=1089305 RepID=A0A1M5TAY7_9FLAO|nr:hypothetical protein [Winogradskyella jejuensis]SHH47892.1 hypothetical protein SAMN05444148_2108 [Winogradskyella jejuensis]
MKKVILLFIILLGLTSCKENIEKQTASDDTSNTIENSAEMTEKQKDLKKNAIPIESLSKLSNKIYDEIANFEILMIGEMHGTNEPAQFAYGLCELITEHEDNVIMAMEIRSSLMNNLSDDISISELKELDFFRRKNFDGRNGVAWLDLVHKSIKNERIILKFIDNSYPSSPRDSSMYREIRNIHIKYPNTKIVTLTGNVHNSFTPLFDKERIGGYLLKDSLNFNSKKIMSINHVFSEGSMLNNDGTGLKIRTIEREDNIYNTTLSHDMFLYKKFPEEQNEYTHILYTDKVTASGIIEKDDW